MAISKHHNFSDIAQLERSPGLKGKIASQLMQLYRACSDFEAPVVLECGTQTGLSSTVLIEACEAKGGTLVSVDVDDCSEVLTSPNWIFVLSDDTEVSNIRSEAPILDDGIDLIYIDSLHERHHVETLVMKWYPYLRQGAYLILDDIDAAPYRRHSRKDDFFIEWEVSRIRDFTVEFFLANEECLLMEHHFGSTGLAKMTKLSPLGTAPRRATAVVDRTRNPFHRVLMPVKRKFHDVIRGAHELF